jgi:hypothetical protein
VVETIKTNQMMKYNIKIGPELTIDRHGDRDRTCSFRINMAESKRELLDSEIENKTHQQIAGKQTSTTGLLVL